jgi:threonine dehydrogenase-like Zn-dependent dehydrogenase
MYGAGDVRIESVPDGHLIEPTDALVRVTHAAICGSDLWPYKAMEPTESGRRMGHEFIGVVEGVGADVRSVKRGELVVSPFLWSDGSCVCCREGLHSECLHGGRYGFDDVDGGQGEAVRVSQADGTLVALPTEQIILLGNNPERITLGQEFGATDVVSERGEEAVERVRELTGGLGPHAVLECVGLEQAVETALLITRPGGAVGRVGIPEHDTTPTGVAFWKNASVGGGPAPVRACIEELLPDVLEGRIEPGRVFDRVVDIDEVPDGYRAMNDREAIKVMVRP